jgi:ribosomal RNA-processing protein 36
MSSKRKAQPLGLERRVRAKKNEDWELEAASSDDGPSEADVCEEDIRGEGSSDDEEQSGSEPGSEKGSEVNIFRGRQPDTHWLTSSPKGASETDTPPKVDLSSVSFGALARAQASLPDTGRKSKKLKSERVQDGPSLREEIQQRRSKGDSKQKSLQRSSKHAPQEQTSKKPVSRRREILPDTRRKSRDPRFDPLMGKLDEAKARKAYAFLDEYRDSEMADLRTQVKKTKNPEQKEQLKRQLLSMESRKKAQKKKDEEEELLGEHRRKEKELVAQGKQPFYLKKSEQKKQLLTNRFSNMSKGQVDRAIERKRKKMAGKEKKELGSLQRVSNRH